MTRTRRAGRLVLEPADALAVEALDGLRLSQGATLRATLRMPRNSARNRWFHALLAVVADALGDQWTPTTVKHWLKVKCGLCDLFEVDGQILLVPRSTAFAAMDEIEFAAFCDRAVRVIVTELMPGMSSDDLRREVDLMLGGK
ncbi:MAG: hypothetical protein AAFR16_01130 [Pseudomonadota bacterium]